MVSEMAHNVLSNADIKAICKSRDFPAATATSKALFEHTFLSPTGLKAALSTLTEAEIAVLHLLRFENRTVDISFFERVYGNSKTGSRTYYGTFTQQFKPIFDSVHSRLVRKGLLIITEAKTNSPTKTKMELWRYYFPVEFGAFLPAPFSGIFHKDSAGSMKADRFRVELLEGLHQPGLKHTPSGAIQLVNGSIEVKKQMFSRRAVEEWRKSTWGAEIVKVKPLALAGAVYQFAFIFQGYLLTGNEYRENTPLPFIIYALSQLKPGEWVAPQDLDILLNIAYGTPTHPPASQVLTAGYENGCLARQLVNDRVYYRLPGTSHSSPDRPPQKYLKVLPDGTIQLEVENIPYQALETLNRGTYLAANRGQLVASPSIGKLLDAPENILEHEIMGYLKEQSATFRASFQKFEAGWGKLILHQNLLVARVANLDLRVKLHKAFGAAPGDETARVIFLPDEYIAFPPAMLGEIEKVVKKAGHVVKTIQAK